DFENSSSLSIMQLLELIDSIERLGLSYRFQKIISQALEKIASINENNVEDEETKELHAVSLKFRLLRQHGYNVSEEFLTKFKASHGGFMECLQTDIKGLLSLYEASYLAFEGERYLHEAKLFTTEHLLKLKGQENIALKQVYHALELPLFRRIIRGQARVYIEAYAEQKDANLLLLKLAKLDFNMVQSAHKKELHEVYMWWKNIGLARILSFVRDRLLECFFWMVGVVFEPQYHSCRIELTKVCSFITVIDDVYDVYGSLDELNIFTNAVKRWDIDAVKHMPEHLQLAFTALYNTVNQMGSKASLTILVKVWGELCESFLVEAKWTHSKCMPTLRDYLDNAWVSGSGVVILTHGYFLINKEIKKDAVKSLETSYDLLKWSSMLLRLCNDLGTSSAEIERGKTANTISCYMHENDVSEEVARGYVKLLIDEAWSKLTKARVAYSSEFKDPFFDMAINLARISH
nr:(E)-beta-ocimene synthase, chloroplastic-like [Tanacetum cinerariifolium]